MASLAQLPEIVGFFSYSREDDEAFRGSLSALRDAIARELGSTLVYAPARDKKARRLGSPRRSSGGFPVSPAGTTRQRA